MPDDMAKGKESQIPTNLRLLLILEEVAARGVAVKPSELTEAMGLPKPTVHRLLQTAEAEGFLQRDIDGRAYGPGPRLRALSMNTMSSERLRTARLAILKSVSDEIGETCNLTTPDREGMTYLDRVETSWPLRIQLPIGTQVPFHATSSGKLYLSTLRSRALQGYLAGAKLTPHTPNTITDPEALARELGLIRKQGYATDHQEFLPQMVAVAVPVLDAQDRLLATLAVHAPLQRRSVDDLLGFLDVLRDGARRLSQLHAG
ncbi:IclR family transcriptional regulator [Roseovarius nubinhibens]|uniref:ArsR family transcriptional regulator n=1 Tax=Roseovarius nubinhibens TaxID=314263 RepID=A0A348WFG6_9RHOB|nr:ArsR family transcriptional regulator [Roseovarius nubinhibens]